MASRLRSLIAFTFLISACRCLNAQSKRPEDLSVGKILVAPRDSPDPLFAESVIVLVRYADTGVLGLMVNRRTTVPISRALGEVKAAAGHTDPVYVGGPVELGTVLAVARGTLKPTGATAVFGELSLIASKATLEKSLKGSTNPATFRMYLGYCGWTRPQLESEIRRGGWYIFDRNAALVFDTEPATLWSRLVEKTEMRLASSRRRRNSLRFF